MDRCLNISDVYITEHDLPLDKGVALFEIIDVCYLQME